MILTKFKAWQPVRKYGQLLLSTKTTPLAKIRNIGIIAHIDAGKTTTTERMLYYSGITQRIGNVDQGDTVTDYLPAERERGITIQSAAITIPWNNHKVNLIDTPGHADFTFEVIRSLKVLDGVVTILDAVAGVEAQTEKVWKQSNDIPKLIFINKMDREGAGFSRTVKEIISILQTRVLLLNVPFFQKLSHTETRFVGVLDVLNAKLLRWGDDGGITVEELSGDNLDEVVRCRESLIETLGEFDETVIDSFLETEDYMKVPSTVLQKAIRNATLSNFAIPVLCGASFKNIGVQPLMDAVTLYLPNPLERLPEVNSTVKSTPTGLIINNNENLTIGLVFKVITDPIRGIMNFVRIYSGRLNSNSSIYVNGDEQIRIGKLLVMHANIPQEVSDLKQGNIGVIVSDKLKTGDTISSHVMKKKLSKEEKAIVVNKIDIPPSVFTISLEPRTSGDKRSMDEGLNILAKEDPSLKISVDEETGQTLLSGMGELHLEIARDRLKDLKAKFETGKIMVSYKESILNPVSITKELDGVVLKLTIGPNPKDVKQLPKGKHYTDLGDGNYFISPYKPNDWFKLLPYETLINALISGVISSIQKGPILKNPLGATLITIDSIEIPDDFNDTKTIIDLIRQSIMELIKDETNFEIMEPIMKVVIEVNSGDMGNVIQDLTSQRNGVILSIADETGDTDDVIKFKTISESQYLPFDQTLQSTINETQFQSSQLINAEVPLKEMIGYLSKLRKLTQGRSTFHMEFKGMELVTRDRAQEILNEQYL